MEVIKLSAYPYAKIYKMAKAEIEKIDFALCQQPLETLEHFYNRQLTKPDLLCNGGFFNMQDSIDKNGNIIPKGDTIFTYIDEGKEISINTNLLEGMGVLNNNDLFLTKYEGNFKDFICGYPVLIKNGVAYNATLGSELNYNARRTILAYDNNYIYLIAVENPGYNLTKLKSMLLALKVTNAINLDGGGSTRVLVNGTRATDVVYSRPIDNVVAFYLKKKVIYRVQTGAFSVKANAESLQNKIRSLNDTINAGYKNAYIRIIDGLYKVQIGAFSKKENADRVVADLKSKGFTSFITTK